MLLHAATLSEPILIPDPIDTISSFSQRHVAPSAVQYELSRGSTCFVNAFFKLISTMSKHNTTHSSKKSFWVERLPLSMPLISLQNIAQNILTVDANSILHLLTFSMGLLFWWITNAITERFRLQRWRKSIPLVIGGWGFAESQGQSALKRP